ncbi:hydantoinase/oxoprolinase domain-containing protein [Hirsutella rhossiliensis]|uniref:Hydantoinase/oxoprolinase domain-containing protein n=1 Tax=Hirsutella rhossiliensis TaxID=111463 RepID=A0A9P8NAR8_9HYPO|nr:hydantoinase/oxoprolinase domain-containing protein [Hirsutella rhossiliensis]KAH0967722.1 hydantoinase/oxoprolinase domain-containing protein [Hirsutella rhossiliensis]
MSLYRIGVDVGGTNTDAAILDIKALDSPGRGVLASHKAPTTPDITSGIEAAIRAVLASSAVDQNRVLSVTIGTTHFINALVEADARRLERVAVVRLCGPFTRQLPPLSGFPVGLHSILDGGVYYLDGGLEMDGREIAALDPEQIRTAARDIVASGVKAVALIGVFSPLDHEGIHEERCKRLMLQEAPELIVVCSHDIGPTGFLERENATILNAAILRTGHRVKRGFRRAMARLRLTCPLYLSQNDGTLIDADMAAEFPIKTFASGPTNSMTGAAFLAGVDQRPQAAADAPAAGEPQILVVDIGGTTTDVCALLPSGFPRQAPGFVELGGVRTAFSMPEVISIGLGGGSKSRIFGGPILTATDVIVAAGKASLGDAKLVQDVPRTTIDLARSEIKAKLETLVDKMKISAAPVHVLLVGGGAILVQEKLAGVDMCIHPVHQGAANAVGAAIAKVSGEVDTLEVLGKKQEKEVIDAACKRAVDLAVEKGASREDVKIVEINKMPLQYMSQETIRIQVRAVGKLAIPEDLVPCPGAKGVNGDGDQDANDNVEAQKVSVPNALEPTTKPTLGLDLESYRPDVRGGVWYVSEVDLEFMATGCGVLGTGGGGPTYYEYLKGLNALRAGGKGKMRIISPKALKDDDVICFGAWYGSPSVINERTSGGNEIIDSIDAVNKIRGIDTFSALFLDEIGGGNGMSAFPNGVHYDLPIIDGDAMGRAYPTLYHTTFSVYGYPLVPCAITDAAGNVSVALSTNSPERLEKIIRTTAVELGLTCAASTNPLPGSAIKAHGIPNTLSLAWYLGRAVHLAKRNKASYVDAIFDVCAGKLLFSGKITDVRRYIGGGYTMGAVMLAPLSHEERESPVNASRQQVPTDTHMTIPFQNEFLYAAYCDQEGSEASQQVVCTVPNLISILGQDGEAIGSQDLRYGLRVNVIALPAHPLWRTPEALKVGGPEGFDLKMAEVGVDMGFTEARSVIDEFGF